MSGAKITAAEKLEIQFKKWLNSGHLDNVVLRPPYSRSGLPEGEMFLLDIIDKAGCSIPFTGSGFLMPGRGFIRYAEVKRLHSILESLPLSSPANKQELMSRVQLTLADGSTVVLKDVGEATVPLRSFFEWLLREAH